MTHLSDLIQDLGLILMAAAVVTLLFKKIKQPIVLGYLIAGFLVGPNFNLMPTIKDPDSVAIWAEIGVIFMLFGLGLEFSFKKLTKVGKSATITATVEILVMLGIGYLVGQLLGWSKMDSLFLGGILSISSTTIIVRAFDELGLKGKSFVSLVFGVLIVEDLIAILLLVLLSSVAVTQSLSGIQLITSSIRLGFFLVLWFLLGIYILPIFLRKTRELLTDETLLIVSIGLCLMMVIIAGQVGFSPALGAFVMGSLFAETSIAPKIEHLIHPVKDLFSAIFFVSVGMMINPGILTEYFWVISLVTVITIVGKFISTGIGALISGSSFRNSVLTGMSVAQIGEFSFIIATLGMTLKVTSDFLYPIAVAVSAITTFSTPYMIKFSERFAERLSARIPTRIKEYLSRYEVAMSASSDGSALSLIWKEYGVKILLNGVVVIAITMAMGRWALPYVGESFREGLLNLVACAVTLLLALPFLWAIFFGNPAHGSPYKAETAEQLRKLQLGVSISRFVIGCALIGFVVSNFTSMLAFTGVMLVTLAALGVSFFTRFSAPIYERIERRFISNLSDNERSEIEKRAPAPELAPWNATLAEFTVSSNSPFIVKTLAESGIKEKFGVTLAMIERGDTRILAPKRGDILLPGDKLFLIGSDDQLGSIRKVIENKPVGHLPSFDLNFGLTSLVLTQQDPFINKSIRECGIRETSNVLIVGIEREGRRYLSPDSSMILLSGDLIWLVGDKRIIKDFLKR